MASKTEVAMHAYLLRGPAQLFAETRAKSSAFGVSMAAFIRDAISRALVEANARETDNGSDACSLPDQK